jgi:hypothetical protein
MGESEGWGEGLATLEAGGSGSGERNDGVAKTLVQLRSGARTMIENRLDAPAAFHLPNPRKNEQRGGGNPDGCDNGHPSGAAPAGEIAAA